MIMQFTGNSNPLEKASRASRDLVLFRLILLLNAAIAGAACPQERAICRCIQGDPRFLPPPWFARRYGRDPGNVDVFSVSPLVAQTKTVGGARGGGAFHHWRLQCQFCPYLGFR